MLLFILCCHSRSLGNKIKRENLTRFAFKLVRQEYFEMKKRELIIITIFGRNLTNYTAVLLQFMTLNSVSKSDFDCFCCSGVTKTIKIHWPIRTVIRMTLNWIRKFSFQQRPPPPPSRRSNQQKVDVFSGKFYFTAFYCEIACIKCLQKAISLLKKKIRQKNN